MTPEQLRELKAWARQLGSDERNPETRAAGRAILKLVDEVERLRAENGDPSPPSGGRAPAIRRRGRRRTRGERSAAPAPAESREAPAAERDAREEGIREARRVRNDELRRRSLRKRARVAVVLVVALAVGVGAFSAAARIARPEFEANGPPDGAAIGARRLDELVFWVRAAPETLERMRWKLDGADVTADVRLAGDRLVYDATRVVDGRHALAVSVAGPFPGAGRSHDWTFAVDRTAPRISVPLARAEVWKPATLTGRVDEKASVRAGNRPVTVRDGRFTVSYATIPDEPVRLVAMDEFGNVTRRTVRFELVPRRPPAPVRSVHVTSFAWATPSLREPILDLVEQGKITAVELDLKDEAGIIGFRAKLPLARRMGAARDVYDLKAAVDLIHDRGARVIGRLVAFRDPIHARAAWAAGRRAEVVQAPGGAPYSGYGGFTNPANRAVQQYNIGIASEAAAAGVDEILYDYVRRPDGPLGSMVFPGLVGTPEAAIEDFLRETRRRLRPYGTFLGASVFGVAATRPLEVAQDIPRMARHVDYIAPMLYPSHWGPGEYNVASPNSQPYDIIFRSLRDFKRQTRGRGARVVPWLQDFSLGVTYGEAEVRAQIRAARDAGIGEWILWDPLVTYTSEALDAHKPVTPRAARPRTAQPPAARSPADGKAAAVAPNELGRIPVIMYHQIRADGGGPYDLTAEEFRAELERLWREKYRPVRAIDLVRGTLDVPAGTTPVVLTFDDSTKEQFAYDADGEIKPDTALGIMLDFAEEHPEFKPAGTFYVNREPFAGVAEGSEMLRYLAERGFELGNHTHDHIPFNRKDPVGVQRALVLGKRIITAAVPDAPVRTLALPLGVMPEPAALARAGRWGGETYRHDGVFLVGAEPAPSPFSKAFDPGAIPRIRTSPWRGGEQDYSSGYWLTQLRQNPETRYVSDGNPRTVSFPAARRADLAPAYRARANQS